MGILESGERLLSVKEVSAIAGVSRSAIYSGINEGHFPRPIKLGKKSVRWRVSDIEKWLAELPASNERN